MATTCMLPTAMACCASQSDIRDSRGTLRDVIPLTSALRDAAFTLSSHCQPLIMPPPVATASRHRPSPPASPSAFRTSSNEVSSRNSSPVYSSPGITRKFSGVTLPILEVSSEDLRYRGEGAEHIVLRVLTSGQVLRLRKTTVGSVNCAEDLILRANRDEEFLRNVARPILGPLLTDESYLIRIKSETVKELKDAIESKREVHRHHKDINDTGIACICPDAASIFISRHDSPTSSSSPIFPDLSSSPHSTAPSQSTENSSMSCILSEENLNEVRDSPIHCEGILVSHELTQETKLNIRTCLPLSTSSLTNELFTDSRHVTIPIESRIFCKLAEMNGDPCHNSDSSHNMSTPLLFASQEPRNICIEIKPKQGFIDTSTPDLPLCRYCIKQYLKIAKNSKNTTTSSYCPLDLFSGNVSKMRRAVDGLLDSPQNNLKVFVDGEHVDDCKNFSYLRDIIIVALTYDFCIASAKLPTNGTLSPLSPLGRTLAFQKLDELGVHQSASLYNDLVRKIGNAKIVDELLQDLQCWTGDSQFCQSTSKLCSRCFLDDESRYNMDDGCIKKKRTISDVQEMHQANNNESLLNNFSQYIQSSTRDTGTAAVKDLKTGAIKSDTNDEDMIRKLQAYLLATTAKDLSLMILLSGPHKSAPSPPNVPNSSPFIIELKSGEWFKCQVTGVDLVAKPPSKIFKHEKDYMQLKAVLEELRRQKQEPPCCKT